MGIAFGAYAIDSGATWQQGTDYRNPAQQAAMLESIRKTVTAFRDKPYILLWCLGNENNYGVASNAGKLPVDFAQFLERGVKLIHELDPNHPVAYCNGDLGNLG